MDQKIHPSRYNIFYIMFLLYRYEYSIGESGGSLPGGVFYTATERVWFDAGQQTSAILPLPTGENASYIYFGSYLHDKDVLVFKVYWHSSVYQCI